MILQAETTEIAALIGNNTDNSSIAAGYELVNLGISRFANRDYETGMQNFDDAIRIAEEMGDPMTKALFLGQKGLAVWEAGHYPPALECFLEVLKIAEENNFPTLKCDAMGNIGMVMLDAGDLNQSVNQLKEALAYAIETEDKPRQIVNWGNLGHVYLEVSNLEHAVQCFQEALDLARETGDRQAEAGYLNNLGIVYTQQNNPEKSISYFQSAARISREGEDRQGELNVIGLLTQALQQNRQFDSAVETLQRGIQLAGALNRPGEKQVLLEELFSLLLSRGKATEAATLADKLLPLLVGDENNTKRLEYLIRFGSIHFDDQDLQKAEHYFQASFDLAVQMADEQMEAVTLGRLAAVIVEQGDYDTSNNYLDRAIGIAEKLKKEQLAAELMCVKAINFKEMNLAEDAVKACQAAIAGLSSGCHPETAAMAEELLSELSEATR